MDDMSEYKKIYEIESAEHLQSMNEALLALEKEPNNTETINVMFRAAHTLKGMSATMGYSNISQLTHKMENLMDRVRKNEIRLGAEEIDVLFECLDDLEKMAEIPENSSSVDISRLLEKILILANPDASIKIPLQAPPAVEKPLEVIENKEQVKDGECDNFVVTVTLQETCMLKSARSTVVMRNLSEIGKIIGTNPPLKDIEDEKFEYEFSVIISTKEDIPKIEDAVKKVSEIAKVSVKKKDVEKLKTQTIDKTCDVGTRTVVKSVQSVRVNIERLDSMMDLVGELIINKIRLIQLSSQFKLNVLEDALASLDRLTNDLQEEIMASRMVPLDQIFNRFPRMARDLAKKEGKEIDLIIEGSDIELDRTVLDEVGDPLVHILRNCIDHGIETPDIREKNGKNRKGAIKLMARREKNQVIIDVEDDGKGMDPLKFREIAVKKGLITKEDALKLSDPEALNLSYLPGFSTTEKVTDVSGRGVGMDVVRTKIEGMGGSVKLDSKIGAGTKITLKLPLTVAIIHSQMVKVAGDTYAIPIINIIRDLSIHRNKIKTIEGQEVVLIRGEVLPLIRLSTLFGSKSNDGDDLIVVVVEKNGSNIGLVVDQVIGKQEVIIKPIDNRFMKGVKGFAGATILGDGNVALIIDVGTLL